jgi:drug/metabolite transporter (DMT)-like permease
MDRPSLTMDEIDRGRASATAGARTDARAESPEARRTAYLFLTLTAVFFGGTWVAGKLGVESIPPLTLAAFRFSLASLLLFAWVTRLPARPPRATVRDLPLILALGSTAVAGYNVLFLYGLKLAPASDGAIIVPGLAPVFTAALAWPVLNERMTPTRAAGLATAIVGLVLVMNPTGEHDRDRLLGDLLFLFGAGCWAIYSVIGKSAIARFGAVGATLYATVSGALMLLPFAILERGWEALAAAPMQAWLGVLYLGVFGTVIAFVFFYEGVSRVGAARASAFAFLVPIFGVLSSVALLGERLSPVTLAGGLFVLAGLGLVQRTPASPRSSERAPAEAT